MAKFAKDCVFLHAVLFFLPFFDRFLHISMLYYVLETQRQSLIHRRRWRTTMKTCAFTGHRPQHLPFGMNENDERCTDLKETLKEQIINLIETEDVTHFITGMALGVDLYAAEIVLDLKARYPSITLESAIPCETQAVKWSAAQRERYYDIAAQCDKETMLQSHYSPDCMDKRNRYMVDHADYILAVWNGCPSGTGNTVRYAHKKGKSIIVINPDSLDVTRE